LRTAAELAASFPRSPSRKAGRAFCFAALVFIAFSPNTGENDDRAAIKRGGLHARAASRWFENDKVTHLLSLRMIIARALRRTGLFSCGESYRADVDKVSQDVEKRRKLLQPVANQFHRKPYPKLVTRIK
jgi:hypothetical protein